MQTTISRRATLALLSVFAVHSSLAAQLPCYEANRGTNLNMGFGVVVQQPLGFTFPVAGGGQLTSVGISSNGFVWLGNIANPGMDISIAEFVGGPRIAAMWTLLDPSLGPGVFFNSISAGGGNPARAVVTWEAPDGAGGATNLVQLQMLADGRVIVHHGAGNGPTMNTVVGINGGGVGGRVDLSTASYVALDSGANPVIFDYLPFSTAVGPTYDLAGATFEFTPNGLGGYQCAERIDCRTAAFDRVGNGCPKPASFYEFFPQGDELDLSGQSLWYVPNGLGGWQGVPSPNPMFTGFTNSLNLGVFGIAPVPLPFPWTHPAGTTTMIDVTSDGLVWLVGGDPNNFNICCDADVVQFLTAGGPMLAPFWMGFDPSAPGAGVYFDVAPGNQVCYVTWANVPEVNGTGLPSTFQLALHVNGTFEFHYGTVQRSGGLALVGYSTGNGAADPGQRDVTRMPWDGGVPGAPALTLAASPGMLPHVGSTFAVEIDGFGGLPAVGALVLGGTPLDLDLAPLMTGCTAYVDFLTPGASEIRTFVTAVGPQVFSFAVPSTPALIGQNAFLQGAELRAGANSLGIATSNGGVARVGL